MATVLNRKTKQLLESVNTPDYPKADWIINPDTSSVKGFDPKYWAIIGDSVALKSKRERDVIDIADIESGKDSVANTIDVDPYLKAFAAMMLDEINLLRSRASLAPRTAVQFKIALRGKL